MYSKPVNLDLEILATCGPSCTRVTRTVTGHAPCRPWWNIIGLHFNILRQIGKTSFCTSACNCQSKYRNDKIHNSLCICVMVTFILWRGNFSVTAVKCMQERYIHNFLQYAPVLLVQFLMIRSTCGLADADHGFTGPRWLDRDTGS
jgi:hypothetical protein